MGLYPAGATVEAPVRLTAEARKLEKTIAQNVAELLE